MVLKRGSIAPLAAAKWRIWLNLLDFWDPWCRWSLLTKINRTICLHFATWARHSSSVLLLITLEKLTLMRRWCSFTARVATHLEKRFTASPEVSHNSSSNSILCTGFSYEVAVTSGEKHPSTFETYQIILKHIASAHDQLCIGRKKTAHRSKE